MLETFPLLIMDTQAANFFVPVNVPSISIGGQLLDPNAIGDINHNSHHHFFNEHHAHQHITRKHLHSHTHLNDHTSMTYVAPSVTKNFKTIVHQLHTYQDMSYQHVTNKLYKSVNVVPSMFFTEFHITATPRTTTWENLALKPDIYTKSEIDALLATEHYTKNEIDSLLSNTPTLTNYYTKIETDTLLANQAPANHQHSHYVTSSNLNTIISNSLADRVDYNSLGLVLQGYEQIDSKILRHVSSDANYHTLRYYANNANVDIQVPTKQKIESIEVSLALGGLFSGQ